MGLADLLTEGLTESFELVYATGGHGGPYKTKTDAREAAEKRLEGGNDPWIAVVNASDITDLANAKAVAILYRGEREWEAGPSPLPKRPRAMERNEDLDEAKKKVSGTEYRVYPSTTSQDHRTFYTRAEAEKYLKSIEDEYPNAGISEMPMKEDDDLAEGYELEEALNGQVATFLTVFSSMLTQADMKIIRSETKRGGQGNIYRLGLWFEALERVRARVTDVLHDDSKEAAAKLLAAVNKEFTPGPPAEQIRKSISAYIEKGTLPKIPISKEVKAAMAAERAAKKAAKAPKAGLSVGPGTPGQKFTLGDVEVTTTLHRMGEEQEANFHHDGKDYYVDTGFVSASQAAMSGFTLKHIGMGEFELVGPEGTIEFDRMRGKPFPGMVGRSHKLYDNKDGALIKKLMAAMKGKAKESKAESLGEGAEGSVGYEYEFDGAGAPSVSVDAATGRGKMPLAGDRVAVTRTKHGYEAGKPEKIRGTMEFVLNHGDMKSLDADLKPKRLADFILKTGIVQTSGIPKGKSPTGEVPVQGEIEIYVKTKEGKDAIAGGLAGAPPAVAFTGTFRPKGSKKESLDEGKEPTRAAVKKWMTAHVKNWVDPQTGEVNSTKAAEDAADEFGKKDIGGWLDDEQHWVWEIAAEVADAYKGESTGALPANLSEQLLQSI